MTLIKITYNASHQVRNEKEFKNLQKFYEDREGLYVLISKATNLVESYMVAIMIPYICDHAVVKSE